MRSTEISVLIAALFACAAFFHKSRAESQSVVALSSGGFTFSRPAYARLPLMILAEGIAGTLLYGLFTVMPLVLQALITVAVWTVVWIEIGTFPKNKSIGSLLSAVTGLATFSCGIVWTITDQEAWSRLTLVGACLMAGLIFLDRRQEWLDIV